MRVVLVLLVVIVLFVSGIFIFAATAPQFGQIPEGDDLARISKSSNYKEDGFINLIKTEMGSFSDMMSTLPEFFSAENTKPEKTLPVKFGQNSQPAADSSCFITWYGHSAFLVEVDGQRILIDPMLGEASSPVSFFSNRFPYEAPIPMENLVDIDAIIISHDHYDHLDYPSVVQLKDKVDHFYTALGVGSHLKAWGVEASKITELDWWEDATLNGLHLVACPSRHFSGRGLTDQNKTQWASWVITSEHANLYFSGDGGYGPHFKEIGEQYGPFDLAMMECGQYNEAWSNIHMMPEESVLAGQEVRGRVLMPIHWGAFDLSIHEWTDPITRFKAEAEKREQDIIHPFIGERFELNQPLESVEWWKE